MRMVYRRRLSATMLGGQAAPLIAWCSRLSWKGGFIEYPMDQLTEIYPPAKFEILTIPHDREPEFSQVIEKFEDVSGPRWGVEMFSPLKIVRLAEKTNAPR